MSKFIIEPRQYHVSHMFVDSDQIDIVVETPGGDHYLIPCPLVPNPYRTTNNIQAPTQDSGGSN